MIEVKRKPKRTVLVSLGSDLGFGHKQLKQNPNKLRWNEINSFEDACSNLGIDPIEELGNEKKLHRIAAIKLETIALAINEGWIPDWKNKDQQKWHPWFKYNKLHNHKTKATENDVSLLDSFSMDDCHCRYDVTSINPRMCFSTKEKAKYTGEKFLQLYNDYFIQ